MTPGWLDNQQAYRTRDVTLRNQAEEIWRAGVAAVDSKTLIRKACVRNNENLQIVGCSFSVRDLRRIVVVGAGKAGAGMALGIEEELGVDLVDSRVSGWVNVPSDCVRTLRRIHLHGARPAGVNEPTADGIMGSQQILRLVESLTDEDLCLVLISGGGSALLPAPVDGISLEDKLTVTRSLMHSGATIQELNTVRKRLSRIKGGGLLRAAKAGRMIGLVISDVAGDPLDIIASGPTVCDTGRFEDAVAVLERIVGRNDSRFPVPSAVWKVLDQHAIDEKTNAEVRETPVTIECQNFVIGNNETAVDAAAEHARNLGFEVQILGHDRQGIARNIGVELAELCLKTRDEARQRGVCYVAGGEPIVKLVPTQKLRKGGRNQEVALAAGNRWKGEDIRRMIVMSGGTDGEDGPTDAAGAFFDASIQQSALKQGLNPDEFLEINDSYTFFEPLGGLLKTGPTHTNVMDLQIAIVAGINQ